MAPVAVGEASVVEDLEHHVEDVGVRLLDLVEQHDAEGAAADGLGELAGLVEADVARRRADEPRDRVPLAVLRHIDADHVLLVVEEALGEGAGELRLPDAGGAEEHEGADGAALVLQAGAGAAHGVGDDCDGLLLPDEPLVEPVLEVEEALGLALDQAGGGDARPRGDERGDVLLADDEAGVASAGEDGAVALERLLEADALGLVAGGGLVVGALRGGLLLLEEAADLALGRLELGGQALGVEAQLGGGLVDEVDGLVGQQPPADVARAEPRRRDERAVVEGDLVVGLVPGPDAAQDRDGLVDGGLVEPYRMEAAFEGGVLLDADAVLVGRGRADDLELAPRERRLHDVGGVDSALGRSRADDGVQLVDEQDDVAVRLLHLVDDGLEPLLELAPELGAGDDGRHIEREHALAAERLRHVVGDDALREPLGDRRLADARASDEDGVVLGAAGERLHHAANLVVAAYHGVELAVAGELCEVDRVAFEGLVPALGARVGDAAPSPDALHRLVGALAVDAVRQHDMRGGPALVGERGDEQVLGGDVLVAEAVRLLPGGAEHIVYAGGRVHLVRVVGERRRVAERDLDLAADGLDGRAEVAQHLRGDAALVLEEREHDVLDVPLRVPEPGHDLLAGVDDGQRLLGEVFLSERHLPTSRRAGATGRSARAAAPRARASGGRARPSARASAG